MPRGNCWVYALRLWFAGYRAGRYLIVRKSRHTFWPHAMVARSIDDIEIEEFAPVVAQRGWCAAFHSVWFTGRVRKGREEE